MCVSEIHKFVSTSGESLIMFTRISPRSFSFYSSCMLLDCFNKIKISPCQWFTSDLIGHSLNGETWSIMKSKWSQELQQCKKIMTNSQWGNQYKVISIGYTVGSLKSTSLV